MSFNYSDDEKKYSQKNLEDLIYENKFLRRQLEDAQKEKSTPPVLVGGWSAAVVGLISIFSADAFKVNVTSDFFASFFTWLALIVLSILIFTPSYMFFNFLFNKIDKISQSGAYSTPNRSIFRVWIPTLILILALATLAFLSVI